MRNIDAIIVAFVVILMLPGCYEDLESNKDTDFFNEIKIEVNFGSEAKSLSDKQIVPFTNEVPENFIIAIKSLKLIGDYDTEDY